jgi:hypothetical protein
VLELKQKLNAAQGYSVEQMELVAELEHKHAVRNKLLFGKSSEKRGAKVADPEKQAQTGHGPREQTELALVEREHELDDADKLCTSAASHCQR